MTNVLTVYLYDKGSEAAKSLAFLKKIEVHTWHPRQPQEPSLIVFPETESVIIEHGGSFSDFKTMLYALMDMEGSTLGEVVCMSENKAHLIDQLEAA